MGNTEGCGRGAVPRQGLEGRGDRSISEGPRRRPELPRMRAVQGEVMGVVEPEQRGA